MSLFRIEPAIGAEHMKTYQIVAPVATHWRAATCAEVECEHSQRGWATTVLPGSDDEATLRRAADGGIDGHRRWFTRETQPDGFVRYIFAPGQPCFRASTHRVPLERDPLFRVKGGDWRGNPRGISTRTHANGADWVDDFGEHQQGIADHINRG